MNREIKFDNYYAEESMGQILNSYEYDNVPHHNPTCDNYRYLGQFKNREAAKFYYLKEIKGKDVISENRKVDYLGRITLPKLLRQATEIKEDDNLKISLNMDVLDTIFINKNNTEENYIRQKMYLSNLSIQDIIRASDYINELASFIPDNNEVLNYLEDIQAPLIDVIKKCKTEKVCPHCENSLYLSDLPQYPYVCPECDENFYDMEAK